MEYSDKGNRKKQGVVAISHSLMEGGGAMSTYEALSLMILFSMFVMAVLSFGIKK
ncbi:MAG: putative holin-like toxin [Dehalobacterium sp.]